VGTGPPSRHAGHLGTGPGEAPPGKQEPLRAAPGPHRHCQSPGVSPHTPRSSSPPAPPTAPSGTCREPQKSVSPAVPTLRELAGDRRRLGTERPRQTGPSTSGRKPRGGAAPQRRPQPAGPAGTARARAKKVNFK